MERKKATLIASGVLLLFYSVGRIGMSIEAYRDFFASLTPFNLLLTAGVTFSFHRNWNAKFALSCLLIFVLGLAVEILGVHTGWPFGSYGYTERLGIQAWQVPLIIGLNWLMSVYAAGQLARLAPLGYAGWLLLTAFLLVILDLVLEPFAIRMGLWDWHGALVPWQNYFSWFLLGLAFASFLGRNVKQNPNSIGAFVFVLQLLFFLSFVS